MYPPGVPVVKLCGDRGGLEGSGGGRRWPYKFGEDGAARLRMHRGSANVSDDCAFSTAVPVLVHKQRPAILGKFVLSLSHKRVTLP